MTRVQTLSLAIGVALAALAVGWLAGRASREQAAAPAQADTGRPARKVLYYRNPMGLPDTSPVPKKDPMGMDYIPVYEGEEATAPGTVVLTPEKVQTLGVRTAVVERAPLAAGVRASATLEIDETRQYAIAPRFEGWIERLYADQTGMRVRRGQPLMRVYSPELLAAQQEYRVADAAARKLAQSDPVSAASMTRLRDAAVARLRNWQIAPRQLGQGDGGFVLTSPADAVVIEKPVVQGARFEPGETVLRLADLSTVWAVAHVPAAQAAELRVGQAARFESTTLPGRRFDGTVTFVQPVLDTATRTVQVRVALANRDGVLRPGLFGAIVLERDDPTPVLSVPRSAVLDSGLRQVVLVERAPGRFEPREVRTGRRAGDRVEILDGVREGERVVVAANFLIDAESNLQAALQGLGAHAGHGGSAPAAQATAPAAVDHAGHGPAMPPVDAKKDTQPAPARARPKPQAPAQPSPAPADPHAGHAPTASPDPHAGHAPPPPSDPHAGHAPATDGTHDGHEER
ncbi:MAG: efflux RND transporter periplasmic adaptor subunit [Xanthomonadales bacterium]|nr:efflux RND transporter periplasmic adaptor subunit [Xanthomonadales bacterium]MBN8794142.1 efflux RND transporter periplasmic adaptor subunit [Stenotrophomonas nitritireducens]